MLKFFVLRPATTAMFVLFFALLGIVAIFNINVERQPRIEFPLVSVQLIYPGADPEEIEGQVLKDVEDAIAKIADIKKMESRAFDSVANILIEFNLGVDVNDKSAEVKEKIDAIINDLPSNLEKPVVAKIDPFAMPVVWLSLTSDKHSPLDLYEFADKKLVEQFSRITGVGEVSIFGGQERQVKVELSVDLMRKKFISIDGVIQQLQMRNLDIPAGDIKRTDSTVSVKFKGEFASIEDIGDLRLTSVDGNRFKLKDIARVYDGGADPEYGSSFNGKEIIALGIVKIEDGNDVKVSQAIRKTLVEIEPMLEEGMKVDVINDASGFIVEETNRTVEGIFLGIVLTVLVLLFFTGDWRVTLISFIVIPLSILSSFFLVDASGFSINFMTLLAYATSLGTLVANAIVVIEGVYNRLGQGMSPKDAAVRGTTDVVVPVIAACGTNLVVFVPLSFMDGIVGQFMVQFGMTVIYATIFSLIASFTITPMLCGLLLKPQTGEKNFLVKISDRFTAFLLNEYKVLYSLMFRFPVISSIVALGVFFLGVSTAGYIGGEFIPVSDEDQIQVQFRFPLGTRVEKTVQEVKKVDGKLREFEGVKSSFMTAGKNGEENAEIILLLEPSSKRKYSDVELIQQMTPLLSEVPDAEVETIRGETRGGAQPGDISINISGIDYAKTTELSIQMQKIMMESEYFRSVSSTHRTPKPQVFFTPNPDKIERYGLSNAQIGQVVRASIYGDDSNIYREGGEQYDIFIETSGQYRNSLESLSNVFTISQLGLIPLSDLGDIQVRSSTPNVFRRDRFRVIQLNGYINKSNPTDIQNELTEKFSKLDFPEGYKFAFVGNAENQEESGRELGKAFLLAIIFTYMILAAILNSFLHPITISSTIFTSFAGVFATLFFMSSSMNIASMLGMVMLVGLAVNNAILMVEEIELVKSQEPDLALQDIIWKGISGRFRAILMTSLAIVFGAVPQLWAIDLAKASMGGVIVGGVVGSILFTFILAPQTYYFVEKFRGLFKRA